LAVDPSLTWTDLEPFVARQALPVAVKGILDPADAERAVEARISAVNVSALALGPGLSLVGRPMADRCRELTA
jgi:hypothetical protein